MTEPDIPHPQPAQGDQMQPIVFARFRRGLVGETKRVCHLVPLPTDGTMPDFLIAFCGTRIGPGWADLLTKPAGMPCELCIARAPLPPDEDSEPPKELSG